MSHLISCVQITPLSIRPLSSDNPPALSKPYPPAVSVAHVDLLGTVHSANTHVKRDLGFHGRLGTYILLTYGDTLYADAAYSDTWRGMTSDSVALATHDPQVVVDPLLNRAGYPEQFCPLDSSRGEIPSEYALGITNVVSTATTTANVTNVDVDSLAVVNNLDTSGVLFFLLNHRPGGANHILGAGVATVTLDRSTYPPTPRIRRLPPPPSQPHQQYCHWWDGATEPWWGDICALRWADYIYAYGHGGEGNPWVYVARAPASQATRLECYEYWNGEDWQTERLRTTAIGDKESVFWQINQGQVVYSEYFGCFFFVYCGTYVRLPRFGQGSMEHRRGDYTLPQGASNTPILSSRLGGFACQANARYNDVLRNRQLYELACPSQDSPTSRRPLVRAAYYAIPSDAAADNRATWVHLRGRAASVL